MGNLFWLTQAQVERLRPYFLKARGKPRVDDRRAAFLRGLRAEEFVEGLGWLIWAGMQQACTCLRPHDEVVGRQRGAAPAGLGVDLAGPGDGDGLPQGAGGLAGFGPSRTRPSKSASVSRSSSGWLCGRSGQGVPWARAPWRGGVVASLLKLAGLDRPVPDHSTLCRRQRTVTIQIPFRRADGPLSLLADSTGVKMRGDGEWPGPPTRPSRGGSASPR